jgi:hypothetical protein
MLDVVSRTKIQKVGLKDVGEAGHEAIDASGYDLTCMAAILAECASLLGQ